VAAVDTTAKDAASGDEGASEIGAAELPFSSVSSLTPSASSSAAAEASLPSVPPPPPPSPPPDTASLAGVLVMGRTATSAALGCRGWYRPTAHWAAALDKQAHHRSGGGGGGGGGSGGGGGGGGSSGSGGGVGFLPRDLQRAAMPKSDDDRKFRTRICQVTIWRTLVSVMPCRVAVTQCAPPPS